MRQEVITLNEEREVTLTAYIQGCSGEFRRAPQRPAVLILPGGGYAMCSEREAGPGSVRVPQSGVPGVRSALFGRGACGVAESA